MILKFLDREEEIREVEEKYESNKSEFVVIYGRRRIGKTELIKILYMEERL
ncbi:MAG: ATP-binding protein [Candidatus Syntrophoarchaeum sp.]|nr:ATP-binding protein [Candidatus Syntrophoarchaeum sp.]